MLTVNLFSVYLLLCFDMVIRYTEVDFTFGLPDYVRYIDEFVIPGFLISRFCFIHFTALHFISRDPYIAFHGITEDNSVTSSQEAQR